MDVSNPGDAGVIAWCNKMRFTMARDPGRQFMAQHIQDVHDFLDSYLEEVLLGPSPSTSSLADLMKTPGRKKAASTKPEPVYATKPKLPKVNLFNASSEENIDEQENLIPPSKHHDVFTQPKSIKQSSTSSARLTSPLTDIGPVPHKESRLPGAHSKPNRVVAIEDSPTSKPARYLSITDVHDDGQTLPEPADVAMGDTRSSIEVEHSADQALQAPVTHAKELSIIAEDDEFVEGVHESMVEHRADKATEETTQPPESTSSQARVDHGKLSLQSAEQPAAEGDDTTWESPQQPDMASTSTQTFHSITLSSSKESVTVASSSDSIPAPSPHFREPQSSTEEQDTHTGPLPSTSSTHDFAIRTSNSQSEDIVVPIRDAMPTRTPGLARKPSMPQFTGLPAPSPLRKSMRVPQDAIVPTNMTTTYAAAPPMPGGKRSSWLVKAREAHAMEGTGKRLSTLNSTQGASGLLGTKRKSGDMLGAPTPPSTSGLVAKAADDTERAFKLRKLDEQPQGERRRPSREEQSENTSGQSEVPTQAVRAQSPPPTTNLAKPSVEDDPDAMTVTHEDEVMNRFRKTMEGLGARSGKSVGKSLGGTAAAALAEARAAAEARVAQRNQNDTGSLDPITAEDAQTEPAPAVPRRSSRDVSIISHGRKGSDGGEDRRLSMSDLISTSEKGKEGQTVEDKQTARPATSRTSPDSKPQESANTSTSTTPPNSPPASRKPSFTAPTAPVFSKPKPVFVAPPPPAPAPAQTSRPPAPATGSGADFSFKLPAPHLFSLPATTLGIPASMPSSSSQGGLHLKPGGLSAQSSKASIFSDGIFDKEDDIPAWMPSTQDTEYSIGPSQLKATPRDSLDEDDSWHVDDKFAANQMWTPFGFTSGDKDDTMTWSTLPSRSTSQKGGDTGPVQPTENLTKTSYHGDDTEAMDARQVEQDIAQHTATSAFDFASIAQEQAQIDEQVDEDEAADMGMEIDEVADEADEVGSDLENIILNGQPTVSLVQPSSQPESTRARSHSQQSNASTTSSSQSQMGFFGQASKLVNSVLGGSKKGKAEPVKSLQLAAAVAKKQQEELEKKTARLKEMENRRQLAMQRKAEEDKARVVEEERKIKEENERRKREREEHTEKKPVRGPAKKADDDNAKKRKLTVESDKKAESKKPPSKDKKDAVPPRIGKPGPSAPGSAAKTGMAPKSNLRQPAGPSHTATTTHHATNVASSSSAKPVPTSTTKAKTIKPTASSSNIKIVSKAAAKAPARDEDEAQPSQLVQSQMANRVKAQIHAAQPQSQPPITSESIELPDINSEYSDSEDEDRPRTFDPPEWAQSPELRNALQQQSTMNPDDIFGRIGPLRMEEIFRTRQSRFRARTSSANWTGTDQLTAEEEREYARRMGFR
ncbi:hypothetical protein CERSUDRAFT_119010 [Gelatoporia subvermispora B]|uniref:Inner centromere protein ARK-binding domain-containing protein n=1 Tax=Ceriporiopsis subvermispora (strain B) TaxID=914234 RepID=M2R217_CERS8|nr:hypothetical protein CERSUDRAFT_119010 [Gelatoporia subvermispora B]